MTTPIQSLAAALANNDEARRFPENPGGSNVILRLGTVTAVPVGGQVITVALGGNGIGLPGIRYLVSAYAAPAVGDHVVVVFQGQLIFCLGRLSL